MILKNVRRLVQLLAKTMYLFDIGRLLSAKRIDDGVDEDQGAIASKIEMLPVEVFIDFRRFPFIIHRPPMRRWRKIFRRHISAESINQLIIREKGNNRGNWDKHMKRLLRRLHMDAKYSVM